MLPITDSIDSQHGKDTAADVARTAAVAGGAHGALELLAALADATHGRANLVDRAIGFVEADRPLGRRLPITFIPATDEAATIAERTVGDTYVTGVVVTASDSEQRDEENPEAFHGRFDAGAGGLFICPGDLKTEQFR